MRAAISGALVGLLVASTVTAEPTPAPDLAHAKELYDTANQAMSEGRYLDAAQGYGAAYDITHDPILFFKIGAANEKAGRCDVALIYFGRYLHDGKPDPHFQQLAQDHIRACGGDPKNLGARTDAGSSGSAGSAAPAPDVGGTGSAAPLPDTGSAAISIAPPAGSAAGSADLGAPLGSATLPAPVPRAHGNDAAWLMVGGGLAFATLGAVLAYSASSSEQDLKDLYVGLDGKPPTYDATVAKRYQSLVDEGNRYEHLSWASFGIAGGFAIAATILFMRDPGRVEPAPSGVAIRF
ncbi:MAG: hypothetical protein JO257_00895 [Deltaproteobacteria bacterium]|nr:hypothetical protein [Deltaproteobacteria bacterium]